MTDPTKRPDLVDPNDVPEDRPIDTGSRPARSPGQPFLGWIIGTIIVLLSVWAFLGMRHRMEVIPAVQSPTSAPTVH